MNIILYYEIRKIFFEKVRELVWKVFEVNNKNVLKIVKILGVLRYIVRRVIYGFFEDKFRKFKICLRKFFFEFENFII